MKKSKLLAVLSCAALAFIYTACSSPSGGSSGKSASGGKTSYAYTVLPKDTPGSAGPSNNKTITYVTFGSWPQSLKADSVAVGTETSTVNGWEVYTGNDGEYYVEEKGSYYKVEPIKWRILTDKYDHDGIASTPGKTLLLVENIIMGMAYYNNSNNRTMSATVYPNNYEHSKVRAFLNGISYIKDTGDDSTFDNNGFFQLAFTTAEKNAIATTTVVNNAESTIPDGNYNDPSGMWNHGNNQYASDIYTSDKIFLLSEKEITTSAYGFEQYDVYKGMDENTTTSIRIREPTAYAISKGAHQNTEGYGEQWWLRSPACSGTESTRIVNNNGRSDVGANIGASRGIVPALCLN